MSFKKFTVVAVLSSFVILGGCNQLTPEEAAQKQAEKTQYIQAKNDKSLAKPEIVGRLPDGRTVSRVTAWKEGEYYAHFVYYVDDAVVSNNYAEPNGKSVNYKTVVSLPEKPTPDQIIAAAEKIKKDQRAADEAEFERLKKKLGR